MGAILLGLIAGLVSVSALKPEEYCDLGCKIHVMCEDGKPVSHDSPFYCPNFLYPVGLDEDQKKQIVDYHNTKRRYVASGNETRGRNGPQPAAVDMPDLEWDDELADLAQQLANQCLKGNQYVCSNTKRFKVGQSISHHTELKYFQTPISLLNQWYSEVNDFDAKNVAHYRYDAGTRRYAQMVSSRTTKIGCGLVLYAAWDSHNKVIPKGKGNAIPKHSRLVCNYGPDGLVAGQPLYETH